MSIWRFHVNCPFFSHWIFHLCRFYKKKGSRPLNLGVEKQWEAPGHTMTCWGSIFKNIGKFCVSLLWIRLNLRIPQNWKKNPWFQPSEIKMTKKRKRKKGLFPTSQYNVYVLKSTVHLRVIIPVNFFGKIFRQNANNISEKEYSVKNSLFYWKIFAKIQI